MQKAIIFILLTNSNAFMLPNVLLNRQNSFNFFYKNNRANIIMNNSTNITNKDTINLSFNTFLREKEFNNTATQELIEKSKKVESQNNIKLLNSVIAGEFAKNWLYEMINYEVYFPQFMYEDMQSMQQFSYTNTSRNYFYIGYFPSDINLSEGPYYIGAFELVPRLREFRTHLIIQNPVYTIDNEYDKEKILDFKRQLIYMTKVTNVFFKINDLKNSANERYYYSWTFDM
jgi:hypothetical protein